MWNITNAKALHVLSCRMGTATSLWNAKMEDVTHVCGICVPQFNAAREKVWGQEKYTISLVCLKTISEGLGSRINTLVPTACVNCSCRKTQSWNSSSRDTAVADLKNILEQRKVRAPVAYNAHMSTITLPWPPQPWQLCLIASGWAIALAVARTQTLDLTNFCSTCLGYAPTLTVLVLLTVSLE